MQWHEHANSPCSNTLPLFMRPIRQVLGGFHLKCLCLILLSRSFLLTRNGPSEWTFDPCIRLFDAVCFSIRKNQKGTISCKALYLTHHLVTWQE